MSNYKVILRNIKNIRELEFPFPERKGVYVLSGANGSGKTSLLVALYRLGRTSAFAYFRSHQTIDQYKNSSVEYISPSGKVVYTHRNVKWVPTPKKNDKILHTFPFTDTKFISTSGNRFYTQNQLKEGTIPYVPASDYIKSAMNEIMDTTKFADLHYVTVDIIKGKQQVPHRSDKLYVIKKNDVYYSEQNFSLGERLLLNTLDELETVQPNTLVLIDEVELSLHPTAQIKFCEFLEKEADKKNLCIIISTHSIELISRIRPDNVYYIKNHFDDSLEIMNPCYPAYVTKFLYNHSGYDRLILVEDDLAKDIIWRVIRENNFISNQLIHILPCGGWRQVLQIADDMVRNNLMGSHTSILVILDKDVKDEAKLYIEERNIATTIPLNFLPVESLEKFLRQNLYVKINYKLFNELNDHVFLQKSLDEIISIYLKTKNVADDNNGKELYDLIEKELEERHKDRQYLIEIIVKYLMENNVEGITKTTNFLMKKLK